MNIERFKQIEEIYHAAVMLSSSDRKAYLEEICSEDDPLKLEVETLLIFDEKQTDYLHYASEELAAELFTEWKNQKSLLNQKLEQYSIIKLLGKGGMGEVYLAHDTKLDRKVALKVLPAEFSENSGRMNRFIREAKSASALNHPNIITIHEIGESGGTQFIATEFIDGTTLSEFAKNTRMSFKTALEIAIQIASALEEAHSAGIVHRDIKPDNVMIRRNGLVKILDFGIAKLSEPPALPGGLTDDDSIGIKPNATSPGTLIGTVNYMSPEQAKGKDIDTRTDIFSFGTLMYEIISGKLPFERETAIETIAAILHKEAIPLGEAIPEEIQRIIGKCLQKKKSERYQTIKSVGEDLKAVKQDLEYQNILERTGTIESANPVTKTLKGTTAGGINQPTLIKTFTSVPKKSYPVIIILSLFISASLFLSYKFLAPSKQIEAIAVMPFVNASGSLENEYLSDGMTETLINGLSQIPDLSVKARSSVFRYKGKEFDPQKIAAELNVQGILTGRIEGQGDQIILSLELMDAATENILWGNRYIRKTSALVSLQSEIARDVSSRLETKLSGREETKVGKTSTTNPDAYQSYLKGRFYWNRRDAENLQKAIAEFKSAIERDPNYSLAYAGLADCYAVLNQYAGVSLSETIPQTRSNAERAIAIDSQLAEPHATLATLYRQMWEWKEAEAEFKRSIELNPNYATAFHWYSIFLRDLGRYDESLDMIRRANELDPLSSVISINVSQVYQAQGNFRASLENTLKVIELDPSSSAAHNSLAISYLKLGRTAEAVASFEKAVELSKRADVVLRNLGYAYAVAGRRDEAIAIVKGLEQNFAKKKSMAQFVAAVYAGLGEDEKTFEWLEIAFREREDLAGIRWALAFESLHSDPRFKDIVKRMGLAE